MSEYLDVLTENGDFTSKTAPRDECHEKGLWHRAGSIVILSSDKQRILLQLRGKNVKFSPNTWDASVAGHYSAGEFGLDAIIRETKEELGLDLPRNQIEYLFSDRSDQHINDHYINRHFNETFLAFLDIDPAQLKIQESEVQEVKWFNIEELLDMIKDNYRDLSLKPNLWDTLAIYLRQNLK